MKFAIIAIVHGSKYLGEVEADDKEQAIEKGYQLPNCSVSLCHQCSAECDDADISELIAEEA